MVKDQVNMTLNGVIRTHKDEAAAEAGRSWYQTAKATVIDGARGKLGIEEIADAIGITPEVLEQQFGRVYRKAVADANLSVALALYKVAVSGTNPKISLEYLARHSEGWRRAVATIPGASGITVNIGAGLTGALGALEDLRRALSAPALDIVSEPDPQKTIADKT